MQQTFTHQIKVWTPQSVDEAWSLKQQYGEEAEYVGGGTLIQLRREQTGHIAKHLISLESIKGFYEVTYADGSYHMTIGAGVKLRTCSLNTYVESEAPILHQALGSVGARAIQHQATIGGNIAYRKGDLIPALLVLDAELTLYNDKTLQTITMQEYMLHPPDPSSLITAVHLPKQKQCKGEVYLFEKVGRREAFVPSMMTVSFHVKWNESDEIVHAKIAVGGGDHSPQRVPNCESILMHQSIKSVNGKQIHRLIKEELILEGNDFTSGDYQVTVAANLICTCLADAVDEEGGSHELGRK